MDVINRQYTELEKIPTLTCTQSRFGKKPVESYLSQTNPSIAYHNNTESIRLIEENFNCNTLTAQEINRFWNLPANASQCESCPLKWKVCATCIGQVPNNTVRKLYVALQNIGFKAEPKKRITQKGECYNSDLPIDFDEILAVPDIFIQLGKNKICLFLERTSKATTTPAVNQRNILKDHQLKKLGYLVLRIHSADFSDMSTLLTRITKIATRRTYKPLSLRMQRLQTILG